MTPVKLLKKLAAATAAGLLALGLIAGTATVASADEAATAGGGNAGELSSTTTDPDNAGELSPSEPEDDPGNAGELSMLGGGNAGELSSVQSAGNAGELS